MKREVSRPPWFILIAAVTVSISICLIVTLIYKEKFDGFVVLILISNILFEIIPYAVIIILWRETGISKSIRKRYGILGSFVLLILSQSFWEAIHWIAAYTPPHDTSFAIGAFLFTSFFVGGIGYVIGYIIGILVGKFGRKM